MDREEMEKSLSYYEEMLDDRVEDGMTEEEAVAALGSLDDIVASIVNQLPLSAVVKRRVKSSRDGAKNKTLWMVLAICGFPIWLPLVITFAVLVLVVYVVAWVLIVSLYAVVVALGAAGILGLLVGLIRCVTQGLPVGLFSIGLAVICAGLTMMSVLPMWRLSRRLPTFTVWFGRKIKEMFLDKRGVA